MARERIETMQHNGSSGITFRYRDTGPDILANPARQQVEADIAAAQTTIANLDAQFANDPTDPDYVASRKVQTDLITAKRRELRDRIRWLTEAEATTLLAERRALVDNIAKLTARGTGSFRREREAAEVDIAEILEQFPGLS